MVTAVPTERQQLEKFLDRYHEAIADAARRALRHLRRRVPGATELVYDNYNALAIGFGPSERAGDVILSIVAYPRWVTLFFLQGVGLADPAKLLKGKGSRVRHIVLETPAVIVSPDVDALIGQALRTAKVPIDPKRRRSLVIKSVSARQRPRRPTPTRVEGATVMSKIRKSGAEAKAAPRKVTGKAGVDYATVRELALALTDVVDSSTKRGMGFKARGKLMACKAVNRSAEPDSLLMRVGAAERDRLLAAMPEVCYVTPHYLAYESVLVRLAKVDRKTLQGLFGLAWKFATAAAAKPARRRKTGSVFRYL
jgi:hypothetical protein